MKEEEWECRGLSPSDIHKRSAEQQYMNMSSTLHHTRTTPRRFWLTDRTGQDRTGKPGRGADWSAGGRGRSKGKKAKKGKQASKQASKAKREGKRED